CPWSSSCPRKKVPRCSPSLCATGYVPATRRPCNGTMVTVASRIWKSVGWPGRSRTGIRKGLPKHLVENGGNAGEEFRAFQAASGAADGLALGERVEGGAFGPGAHLLVDGAGGQGQTRFTEGPFLVQGGIRFRV